MTDMREHSNDTFLGKKTEKTEKFGKIGKEIGTIVEVEVSHLEKYLCEIKETISKYESSMKFIPMISKKLDLCVLDVDILRDRFFQAEKSAAHTTVQVYIIIN